MATIVRPATRSDLDQLEGMIARVDRGMLTMPSTRAAMAQRVEQSIAAFSRSSASGTHECFFLVMEEAGELIGTASIFTRLGAERPFYSYRISRHSKVSPETRKHVETDILHVVNDYHGDTELGTLFIDRKARGGGRGKLLSFARLMLIAADPQRFAPRAMAEIRGWTDANGRSPFWDAVGAKFFHMDYREADERSALDHRFISDLMPHYPIYVDLLPAEARTVIGKPHPDAEPALALLRSQGFHFNRVIDIFDAGPTVEAFIDQIDVVRSARPMTGEDFVSRKGAHDSGLLAKASVPDFAVTMVTPEEDRLSVLQRIGAAPADTVLLYRMPGRQT